MPGAANHGGYDMTKRAFGKSAASLVTALGLALCAAAWGAYSPLPYINHTWVYQGKGDIQPLGAASGEGRDGKHVRFNETLRVISKGAILSGPKTKMGVEERDSLYARQRWARYGGSDTLVETLPDTVITRKLEYTYDGQYTLANGDSLGFGHRDSMDLFFWSTQAAPFRKADLAGLASPWKGMSSEIRSWGKEPWTQGDAWYLDDVGLYWARLQTTCGQCGCLGTRELMLQSYDGKAVDPGIDPPGAALAKGNRIACGLAKPSRQGPAFKSMGSGAERNALGRCLPAAISPQESGPLPGR
jgi:hypothetical protein